MKVVELYVQHACCSDHVFLYSLSCFKMTVAVHIFEKYLEEPYGNCIIM